MATIRRRNFMTGIDIVAHIPHGDGSDPDTWWTPEQRAAWEALGEAIKRCYLSFIPERIQQAGKGF